MFDIYVDSAGNLTEDMIKETGVKVIPFTYTSSGVEKSCFEEGVPFAQTAKQFYADMVQGADIKTSLIGEVKFIETITPSMQQGRDVLLITITSSLSGTHAQALKAQNALKEAFPDRKMYVVDSANASLGEGLFAVEAAKMRDGGSSIDECYNWIEENKYKMNSFVTINELKYLRKSGRVSTITAVAGAILNIKPMLKADDKTPATLAVYSKERGRKRSIDALVREFTDRVIDPANQTVAITHCDCADEAEELAERLKALGAENIAIEFYDLCTGSHVGPGTIALFFFGKDRRETSETAAEPRKLSKVFRPRG